MRIRAAANTALNYAESWLRRPRPASYPVVLDIVLTKACNLRCTFCISYESLAHRYWLDPDLYRRIARKLFPYAWDVQFCSGGEPFFYPHIRDALSVAAEFGCKTTVTTNGMLIDGGVAEWLVQDQSLHRIWLSFDAATKPTLERIRRGANFDKITTNIRDLVRLRNTRGRTWPKVSVRFVIMKSNAHELPALIELARDIGACHVEACYLNVANDLDLDESLYCHPALAADVFDRTRQAAERHRVTVRLPRLPGDDAGGKRCIKPWEMCQIDIDGAIRFCYKSWRQRLGSFDEGFDRIWRGEHYQKLRATIDQEKTFFPYCSHCSMRNGINHQGAHDQRLHADAYVIPGLEHLQTAFNDRDHENRMAFADRKRRNP